MSEISNFTAALILPVAAGVCIARLLKYLGSKAIPGPRAYQWPTTIEREELLRSTYYREFAKLEEKTLNLAESESPGIIEFQQNHLQAMVRSLETLEPMALVAKERYGATLTELTSNLGVIEESVQKKQVTAQTENLVESTDSLLRSLTLEAHCTLAEIEQKVTAELVSKTLGSMGYSLRQESSTIVGTAGESHIRAEVSSAGSVLLDTTSFSGLTCHRELARFEHSLKDEGIVLRRCLVEEAKRKRGVLLTDPFPPLKHAQDIKTEQKRKNQSIQLNPAKQEQYVYLMNRNLHKYGERIKVT